MTIDFSVPRERIEDARSRTFWPNRLLGDYLDAMVARQPGKIAIVGADSRSGATIRMTYADLDRVSTRVALGLRSFGIRRGDVVSFQLPNWWEAAALYIACGRIGAVYNPLLSVFRNRELKFMLALAETKIAVIPATFRDFDYADMYAQLRRELPALEHVFVIGAGAPDSFERRLSGHPWEDGVDAGAVFRRLRPDPNDVTELMYTSGTTGQPKGVLHTHNTLLGMLEEYNRTLGLGPDEVIMQAAPITHQAGLLHGVLMSIMLGATMVLQEKWDVSQGMRLIEEHRATHFQAPTPFLADLAGSPLIDEHDISSLRRFVTAGAPIPRALVHRAVERLKLDVISAWGMTEFGTATCTRPGDLPEKIFGTDGRPMRGIDMRVVDARGEPLPADMEGRLEARGMSQFVGYLKRPEPNASGPEGWFDTGDLARMDQDGYIRITGRAKDLIIRGGQNIPIVEIEEQLYHHPAVREVAIVGIPDARLGERACAFVILNPGARLTFEDMVAYLEAHGTARSYFPERLEVAAELPRTATGKIQKYKLREIAARLVEANAGENV